MEAVTESITKNRQSVRTLRAMVERAYGSGQVPLDDGFAEEITHGWFNVAYRIRLRDGQQVVLKIAPPLCFPRSCKRAAGLRARHGCSPLSKA